MGMDSSEYTLARLGVPKAADRVHRRRFGIPDRAGPAVAAPTNGFDVGELPKSYPFLPAATESPLPDKIRIQRGYMGV